jgi:hypothetical protein
VNLIFIRYAHEKQAIWDATVCVAAAGGGHLECLKYAHVLIFSIHLFEIGTHMRMGVRGLLTRVARRQREDI